ncbi:MAG: type II secretion system F family protein [Phycisphaerales bacterium]|nr:type II secretion system F family protein [Phycisphaerales bacterium]
MTVWRYKAVPLSGARVEAQAGELSAESAADARASLRRIGLQAIDVWPMRSVNLRFPGTAWWRRHLRRRRQATKSEHFDSMATMLEAGLPLLECVDTLAGATRRGSVRVMLVQLRESLRSGEPCAGAMAHHDAWFDKAEIAMVRAGERAGELPAVLRSLADRHTRAGELTAKLTSALMYPAIVACVGVGVVIFLSTKTLPDIVAILVDAGVQPPALTASVMGVGRVVADWWPIIPAVIVGVALLCTGGASLAARRGMVMPRSLRRLLPRIVRRIAVARLAMGLADLVRSGVPVVEALRIVTPTIHGPAGVGLAATLTEAAARVERGEDLADALDDELWFDPEFQRLLAVGQTSGELETVLSHIGSRYERRAQRLIDRLATLLEPAVILVLAILVGLVVLSAVLPMIRLQEII